MLTSNRPPTELYKDGLNRSLAIPQLLKLLDERAVHSHEVRGPLPGVRRLGLSDREGRR